MKDTNLVKLEQDAAKKLKTDQTKQNKKNAPSVNLENLQKLAERLSQYEKEKLTHASSQR